MADVIEYNILGDDLQAVEIILDPREKVNSEAGAMIAMDEGIRMESEMQGGIMGGLKRMVSGESFFKSTYVNESNKRQKVTFASPYPGKIVPIELSDIGGTFICQRDAYLCSADGIDISIELTKKMRSGFFGGEGFILQKLSAPNGLIFVHAGGHVMKKELAHGEKLRVDTGCLVGFEKTVDYSIEYVGSIKKAFFSGEGLFLTTLTGPGTVYIQTLPVNDLVSTIYSRMPKSN
ncbi:MAG: TIGR00266 family protein [Bacillota bacterium]